MSISEKVFKDSNGNIVLFQTPNLALITYIFTVVLDKITDGTLQQINGFVGTVALLIFALLELFQGVNLFRRALGLLVLVILILSRTG